MALKSVKDVEEVVHIQPLFPRNSYRSVLSTGCIFDPSDYREYKLSFRELLNYWRLKYLENGGIFEYQFFVDVRDKKSEVSAFIETFEGSSYRKIIRRANSLESVLDIHTTIAAAFSNEHPGVPVWCQEVSIHFTTDLSLSLPLPFLFPIIKHLELLYICSKTCSWKRSLSSRKY